MLERTLGGGMCQRPRSRQSGCKGVILLHLLSTDDVPGAVLDVGNAVVPAQEGTFLSLVS